MNKDNIILGAAGVIVGVVIAGFVAGQSVNNNNTGMMRMMGMNTSMVQEDEYSHSGMSVTNMSEQLKDLSGDDYDKAFIEMMIDHHDGAVAMAQLSETRANRDEIKQLSKNIITVQEKETLDMKQWQMDWGYSVDEMSEMMHGGAH